MNELETFFKEHTIKGFLHHDEGMALNRYAQTQSKLGSCLEIGSYCGKSTVYLGAGCQESKQTLYAVDHHRGSEEHQLGEEYHDPDLYDGDIAMMDSFKVFRRTLKLADLENTVVPIVASSELTRRNWATPLSMVFIDGGHSEPMAIADCVEWSKHLMPSGVLAIHDIFEKPEDGGQGPYLGMQAVLESGDFEFVEKIHSLVFLKRK